MLIPRYIFSLLDGYQQYSSQLTRFPIQWDPENRRFSFISSHWELKYLYLSTFFLLGLQCIASSIYVLHILLNNNTPDSITKLSWVTSLMLGGTLGVCILAVVLSHGANYAAILNETIKFEQRVIRGKRK